MKQRIIFLFFLAFEVLPFMAGCGNSPSSSEKIVVSIDKYRISAQEFEAGYQESVFVSRDDKVKARRKYFDNLVNQKLILLDAQKRGLDRKDDFLKSIEHFWEQSLLTVAIAAKTKEITGTVRVPEESIKVLYEQMLKEGVTVRSYQEMFSQIRWQLERQMESQLLDEWVDGLRKKAQIKVDEELFTEDK